MKFKKLMGSALAATLTLSAFTGGMLSAVAETKKTATEENVNIVAPYAEATSDEMGGYLYVHFIDEEQTTAKEQLYFSISPNAKEWYILNGGNPVSPITTSAPEGSQGGIRDPYILRKHDNSGYFIIATDLSIKNINGDWDASQQRGSHSIIVWETDDLTDLGTPRMVEIAPKNGTCTWAPEAIWDEEKEAYMVFWSVLANKSWNDAGEWKTGMYWTHHVYRCYTTDFLNFTEPEVYIQSEQKTIDATIIKEKDTYYRFTKIETYDYNDVYNPNYGSKTIFMEKCKSLSGEWQMVSTYNIDGKHWSQTAGYEGPSIFKLNEKDTAGKDQWCLMLDNYGAGGYIPFVTDDITKGEFTKATDISFDKADYSIKMNRHGGFLTLTKAEYNALCEKYNLEINETERTHKEIFSMSFEDNTNVNEGSATATANGEFEYVDGVKEGTKAAKFFNNEENKTYIEITDKSAFENVDGLTVSFAAKFSTRTWAFFAAPNNDTTVYNSENYLGFIWGESASDPYLDAQRFSGGRGSSNSSRANGKFAANDEWKHITVVFGKKYTCIYVDGEQFARTASKADLTTILGNDPTIYIGRANWSGGEYSNCVLDEFKIHNWGMSAKEVYENYLKVMKGE